MGILNWQPRVDLHHQLSASKADALLIELQGYFDWSVWLDLHQHPAGYEPDALLLSYRPIKMVGYPGAAPGVSWSQTKRERLALSYPMK